MKPSWNSHYKVKEAPSELNAGDKVILPSTALEQLLSIPDLPSPLTFQLKHPHSSHTIHCGIHEFTTTNTDTIAIPRWMMDHLHLHQDDHVLIQLDLLPKGTWARLQPLDNDIPDYRAALEAHLRSHYHTLSKHQRLHCRYGGRTYQFNVVDVKPQDTVSITDTDLEVDIDPPLVVISNKRELAWQTPIDLSIDKDQYMYYTLAIPKDTQRCAVQCTVEKGDIDIVISSDHEKQPTLDNHVWSDLTSSREKCVVIERPPDTLYIGLHGFEAWSQVKGLLATVGTNEIEMTEEEEDKTGKIQCDHCHQWVLERTMMLHEGFCRRNNVVCEWGCGKIFKKDSEEYKTHWHCDACTYVGHVDDREKHQLYFHTEKQCMCQHYTSTSYLPLAEHRRTTCPEKLILCRYCHTLVAQGIPSLDARDRLLGLHAHESYCGSRTIDCQKCHKPIPIKDIQVHAKIHDIKRQQQVLPPLCCNRNCVRPRANNKLRLCQFCFGPFWITEDDPKHQKLMQRIARKLHAQLTVGCGHAWCRNKMCATFTKEPKDATTAASLLIPVIKSVARELGMPQPQPELYLCVDESTTKRKFMADVVCNETQGRYELGWCMKAVEIDQDIDRAIDWLEKNAPRKNPTF